MMLGENDKTTRTTEYEQGAKGAGAAPPALLHRISRHRAALDYKRSEYQQRGLIRLCERAITNTRAALEAAQQERDGLNAALVSERLLWLEQHAAGKRKRSARLMLMGLSAFKGSGESGNETDKQG